MKVSGVTIETGEISKMIAAIEVAESRLREALKVVSDTAAKKMVEWAQDNKPWTDITSDAKRLMTGEAYWEDKETLTIAIMHNVEYGIWLELAHEKKYAILEQAIESQRMELLKQYEKLL